MPQGKNVFYGQDRIGKQAPKPVKWVKDTTYDPFRDCGVTVYMAACPTCGEYPLYGKNPCPYCGQKLIVTIKKPQEEPSIDGITVLENGDAVCSKCGGQPLVFSAYVEEREAFGVDYKCKICGNVAKIRNKRANDGDYVF